MERKVIYEFTIIDRFDRRDRGDPVGNKHLHPDAGGNEAGSQRCSNYYRLSLFADDNGPAA